jgi:hypothetical protein
MTINKLGGGGKSENAELKIAAISCFMLDILIPAIPGCAGDFSELASLSLQAISVQTTCSRNFYYLLFAVEPSTSFFTFQFYFVYS